MTTTTTSEDIFKLREEVEELREKREKLLEQLRKLEQERNHFRDERNRNNQVASESFQKVRELKEKRDATNQEISDLKLVRQSVLEEMRMLIEKAQELRGELIETDSGDRKKQIAARKIQYEIEEIDRKLETTPYMDIEEERALMERVHLLSQQLVTARAGEELHSELRKLNHDIKNLKGFLDDSWRQFTELVSSSQSRHQRITELYDQGKEAKDEADRNHELFVQRMESIRELRTQLRSITKIYREKIAFLREQQTQRREGFRRVREEQESQVLEAKTRVALSKYKSGRKLDLSEMKMLMSSGFLNLEKGEDELELEEE